MIDFVFIPEEKRNEKFKLECSCGEYFIESYPKNNEIFVCYECEKCGSIYIIPNIKLLWGNNIPLWVKALSDCSLTPSLRIEEDR